MARSLLRRNTESRSASFASPEFALRSPAIVTRVCGRCAVQRTADKDVMIATRHLPALAALLAVAGIPTVLHSYLGPTLDDGRRTAAVSWRLNGVEGRTSGRSDSWVLDTYGATDFIERHYGRDLTLFVARSFDPKRLYHHPEHGIARGDGYEHASIVQVPSRPGVPIFELTGPQDRLSVYALLYEGEFVSDPIRFQLRNALTSLVRRREAMTLFFVRSRIGGETRSTVESPAHALLLAAIDSFRAQGSTPHQ
jgi:hypothetical protein